MLWDLVKVQIEATHHLHTGQLNTETKFSKGFLLRKGWTIWCSLGGILHRFSIT